MNLLLDVFFEFLDEVMSLKILRKLVLLCLFQILYLLKLLIKPVNGLRISLLNFLFLTRPFRLRVIIHLERTIRLHEERIIQRMVVIRHCFTVQGVTNENGASGELLLASIH